VKILFSSYAFRPSVGGIETVSSILADEFVADGHEVELITETAGEDQTDAGYGVTRRPSLLQILSLLRWSDVFFQNNVSLPSLLPAITIRKPAIVVHQTWIRNARGGLRWKERLKRLALPQVKNVAISHAVAHDLEQACVINPNPYRDMLFRAVPNIARERPLVFLGRLVSDKGVDILLHALHSLREEHMAPELTIIGSGPEEQALRGLVWELGLGERVEFAGEKSGPELVSLLNEHRIMVVPSRWSEPFGVVALEGIACGCVLVGSEDGGLKEAMGPCGITFKNGDPASLAAALRHLLRNSDLERSMRAAGPAHLERFKARTVAQGYVQLMEACIR
jgi:glycogen synthase